MKVASLFARPVLFLVLLQMGPSDTFLVARRKYRPHLSSVEAPPVPARASLSKGVVIVYLGIMVWRLTEVFLVCGEVTTTDILYIDAQIQ